MVAKTRENVTRYVTHCPTCQKNKKQRKKYGHLPEKLAESDPWEVLCVDFIEPYALWHAGENPLTIKRPYGFDQLNPKTKAQFK